MARPLRIEFEGAVYHITSRGNAGQAIFLDNADFVDFLEALCLVIGRFNWILHAYCLMNNHYHLLIETLEGNLSRGMRQLNGVYAQHFNRRHNRIGYLLQGRYKAILVDKYSYLLELCRYVVLNSVRAGLVKRPEEWRWSSYEGTINERGAIACLTADWVLSQFDEGRGEATREYKAFVYEGLKEDSPWRALRGQVFLGGASFAEKIEGLMEGGEKLKEIPRVQRYAARPPLARLLSGETLGDKGKRDEVVFTTHIHYGYTLKEIAEYLGVHYATISRVIKRVEGKDKK